MTLVDIEAASVSSLGRKQKIPIWVFLSVSLPLALVCLIRDEIYWPAFHFADSLALRF